MTPGREATTVATGAAPGKLILAGEHAVVYGHPAIAGAVSLGTTVEARRHEGPSGIDASTVSDPRLWPALATIVPAQGVRLRIASTLPIGCGMGSSAALAVAVVRALAGLAGEELDFATTHARAFAVERAFHGNPSGIDHAVSAMGGLVGYRRTADGPVLAPIEPTFPLRLVVVNTGQPGNTAEMVAGVAARGVHAELAAIAEVVEALHAVLDGRVVGGLAAAGPLLDANHRLLQAIGVSTPRLDDAVEALRAAGAWGAKLAGAGGGGIAFGLYEEADRPAAAATLREAGWDAFEVNLGESRPTFP